MLHLSTIDTSTLELLKVLMKQPAFSGLRLAGGTALALQIGHRKSIDIDLFGTIDFDSLNIQELFAEFNAVKTIKRSKNINIFIINDVKVDFVNYSYPWLSESLVEDNIRMAAIKDIAAMKLAAITGRGSKKDFVDLYFLLQHFSLRSLMTMYSAKYPDGSAFLVLKSLTYFEDAENEGDLNMLINTSWRKIKQKLQQEVKNYA
ncbi:MAG: nucleotidyl transferase AbiEii/AbiGii toxin family protein [Bacteroidales bacterium]|nr:nucleotidyl transferase AbiEii/AbiGii toxin family protein [Bacteroidales bacterium]